MKRYWFGPVVMALPVIPYSIASLFAKNPDEILGVIQDAVFPLDLVGLFVAWVGKDRQLTNNAVLTGRLHFFFHQVFETDGS